MKWPINIIKYFFLTTSQKRKKAPPNLETSTNVEAKNIAEIINPDDHIVCIAKTTAFITLKDHRLEFQQLDFLRIWSHLMEKSLMENFIFCALILFFGYKIWKKKSTGSCFDVITGNFHGAEICELVGLYIQSNLEYILPKTIFGLCRDNVLFF